MSVCVEPFLRWMAMSQWMEHAIKLSRLCSCRPMGRFTKILSCQPTGDDATTWQPAVAIDCPALCSPLD